jgi:hypothetical protein
LDESDIYLKINCFLLRIELGEIESEDILENSRKKKIFFEQTKHYIHRIVKTSQDPFRCFQGINSTRVERNGINLISDRFNNPEVTKNFQLLVLSSFRTML